MTLQELSGYVCRAFFRLVYRARVHGLENVPASGGVIVAINHVSYLDPVLVGAHLTRLRPFRAIGKKELFDVPILGWYLRKGGSIPVDRDRSDPRAMRTALDILAQGYVFLMAPEGTRGRGDRPRTPKAGVAFLAHHAGVPVVPCRVAGTLWPARPGRVWARFGAPRRFEPGEGDHSAQYRAFAEALMRDIYAMEEPQ